VKYASVGYSGGNPQTNIFGRVNYILLPDRWYIYNNIAIENITAVKVKKTVDLFWEGNKPNVDMSSTHTEIFIAADIVAPPTPINLKITRVPGTNTLNVSWSPNIDTVNYAVYFSIEGFPLTYLRNVSHPKNWTLHVDLEDGLVYQYRIRAWDQVGLSSGLSDLVKFNLTDIIPPAIPVNLSVTPVNNGDAFSITWDQNSDDTLIYELYCSESSMGPWLMLVNISHPTNFTTWSNIILTNGTIYYFKIRAWDEVPLASAFSLPETALHRDYIPPTAPLSLDALAISETIINLTWTSSTSTDVAGYRIYINQTGMGTGGPYKSIGEVDSQTLKYMTTGLFENVLYHFVVVAFDEASNPSIYSPEASATTLAVPPLPPNMDMLPEYTNNSFLEVTGTAEAGISVLLYNNNEANHIANGSTDLHGNFSIDLELEENANIIKARTRDQALLLSDFSDPQVVILDTVLPTPKAGNDIDIKTGDTVILNASGSSDNFKIVNYTWSFEYSEGEYETLFGVTADFKFEESGIYDVTLKVTDIAGNWATDTMLVNVTELEKPRVLETTPTQNEQNVPVTTDVTIKFSMSMDKSSVENALSISPIVDYTLNWENNDKTLKVVFDKDLDFNTKYTLILQGTSTSALGSLLENAPFELNFITGPVLPSIVISTPTVSQKVGPGELITVSGSSTGFAEGTEVTVTLGDKTETTTIGSDGTWSVTIKAPEVEDIYTLKISAGDQFEQTPIVVKRATNFHPLYFIP